MSSSLRRPPEYRVSSRAEIDRCLHDLLSRRVLLQLSNPLGATVLTRLWNLDPGGHWLSLEAPSADGQQALDALLDGSEVLAVAYLDQIRLEFLLGVPTLVRGSGSSVLRSAWPTELFRFQRREAFRVETAMVAQHPRARLNHPLLPEMPLQLRVLDLSIGGLALALPAMVPALESGQQLDAVQIELERDLQFHADLRVQHVSGSAQGLRLGCAFTRLPRGAERLLQLYIDQTQKRQRLLKKT